MRTGWGVVSELGLGILRARGADAVSFLQGQLSNDTTLAKGCWQLTGYHTPQGRAIALLRLTQLGPDDLLAVLPLELVPPVIARLQRYVLRAKVQLTDDSPQWAIRGYAGAPPPLAPGAIALPYGSSRQLAVIPQAAGPAPGVVDGTRRDWIASDIADGLPQVYTATSEAFVAQMLNLDVTGGIALDKGCYTGQEIIARAHYRGHVKRRMHRFVSDLPCDLKPGQTGVLSDGRGFKLVEAVALPDGRCEFLAVANPAPGPEVAATHSEEADLAAGAQTQTPLAARQLKLPYELPTTQGPKD
jgi:tRNA-modifying protein YgfZ